MKAAVRCSRANRGVWLVCMAAGLGVAVGLALLFTPYPTRATPAQATAARPETSDLLPVSALPQAWASRTAIPPPSVTPPPSATWRSTPSAAPTACTPTPTRSATPAPTLTLAPTTTPIHVPADADPTRIVAEAIGLDAPVVTVGVVEQLVDGEIEKVWEVADYAAGFHRGSARPGHVGNTVITGHNNVRGEVFRDLHRLQAGDEVVVWVGENAYHYRVDAVYRVPVSGAPPAVLQDNLHWIQPTDDERLTLVTCWPYWSNTHRTIVVAFPAAG